MNVFCSWCNDPIRWAGIEYGVSHSICRRCCREHFPAAAVSLIIKAMENKKENDYGADPIGDGTFRMIPSGDIVDKAERNRRLPVKSAPVNEIFGMSWRELERKQGGKLKA